MRRPLTRTRKILLVLRFKPPNAAAYFLFSLLCLLLTALFKRFLAISFVFAFGVVVFALEGFMVLRNDPYSLRELHRLHEQSRLDDQDDVFCPFCAEVYSSKYPVCPNCRKSLNP